VRADDLGAVPLRALMARNRQVDWAAVDDVIFGCANQAGEDNRNVARMSLLLAGLPVGVPGTTINRLCGSGMDAVLVAARSHQGGRGRSDDRGRGGKHVARALRDAQGRHRLFPQRRDLRHHHRLALCEPGDEGAYGVESMPETGENVADDYGISAARRRTRLALPRRPRRRRRKATGGWRRKSPR
jgi:acetyl-CoA acyltransferase